MRATVAKNHLGVFGLCAALSGGLAPYQCGSDPDPKVAREDDPATALYALATKFKAEGDVRAWKFTLNYLLENYPASRYAQQAELDLEEASSSP